MRVSQTLLQANKNNKKAQTGVGLGFVYKTISGIFLLYKERLTMRVGCFDNLIHLVVFSYRFLYGNGAKFTLLSLFGGE